MPCTRTWIALGLLLAAPVLLAQNSPTQPGLQPAVQTQAGLQPAVQTTTRHHKPHKIQAQMVLPPLPSGPLSQVPMDQIPATPAKVSYQGGMLTISAQNSSLGEILRDVRKLTGASIEIPQGSGASERVVTHLGPGAPRDVLAGLLNGSSFNYVLVGSSSDPTAVSSVILSAKPSAAGDAPAAANVYQNNPGPTPPNRIPQPPFTPGTVIALQPRPGQPGTAQPANAEADDSKDDDQEADDNTDDQAQPQQPGQPAQPDTTGANAPDQQQPQQPDPNQPNAGPRTPEQIMEMLRRPQPGAPVMTPPAPPQQ